mmetsp:Transcript_3154/g.6848  ORF Transcript_3154/g.6848 Transcript_3154/m.6848 type:complete len:123 (-) Transcript_3154:3-371(-)
MRRCTSDASNDGLPTSPCMETTSWLQTLSLSTAGLVVDSTQLVVRQIEAVGTETLVGMEEAEKRDATSTGSSGHIAARSASKVGIWTVGLCIIFGSCQELLVAQPIAVRHPQARNAIILQPK